MAARILAALEPVDSDVDLKDPAQRSELRRKHGLVLLVIAAGGALGALLRYQLDRWWPSPVPQFPWTTLLVNVSGCMVIGGFMVMITERWPPHALVRPFVGTGVLGGYTTFSTYVADIVIRVRAGHLATAGLYLLLTLIGALLAVTLGMLITRRLLKIEKVL